MHLAFGASSEGTCFGVSSAAAMRPLTALLLLAASQCVHAHQLPRTTRQYLDTTLHALLGQHYEPVQRIFSCSRALGPTKCLSALSVWRAERAIEAYAKDPATRFNLTEDVEQFSWMKYSNITDEQLYSQLYDDTKKLLQFRPLGLNMIPGYNVRLGSKGNGTMKVDIIASDSVETGRGSMKKLKKYAYQFAPLMLVPGLVMSAIFPFILPGLKMMTLMVGMMNNMALMGAIFTILRNNAFDDKYEHKVVYVNDGYRNEKYAATNLEEHIHSDHIGLLYDDSKGPPKHADHQIYGEDFYNAEDVPSAYSVNPEWLKAYADGKMMAIIGKDNKIYDVKH
ncbi:hypothetical protein PYW08_002267 [Mythimna loreyi]|uniref:Uncharacterized protein n=1 Tax=Mythimna loreyi TaxID=667449 RepID=A0ACC2R2I3_9NEOP|nr:hypothetical protein PYW08_002267 [Mythimna loreyi]